MPFNINGVSLSSNFFGPNGEILNTNFRKITPDLVTSVYNNGGTILSQGADSNGLYTITFQYDLAGCGGPDSGFNIFIDNSIPWSRVVSKFELGGTAACWTINANGGYGGLQTNLASYDSSQGDILYTSDAQNSFENSSYTIQPSACDNEPTNFMRFGGAKIFYAFFRRINNNPAGPGFGRSCTTTGSGSYCTMSEIYVI